MGHITWISINIIEHGSMTDEQTKAAFQDIAKRLSLSDKEIDDENLQISGEDNNCSCYEELINASSDYPELLFEGNIDGTNYCADDLSDFRVRNGEYERIWAKHTYLPFTKILTKNETDKGTPKRDIFVDSIITNTRQKLLDIIRARVQTIWKALSDVPVPDFQNGEKYVIDTDDNDCNSQISVHTYYDTDEDYGLIAILMDGNGSLTFRFAATLNNDVFKDICIGDAEQSPDTTLPTDDLAKIATYLDDYDYDLRKVNEQLSTDEKHADTAPKTNAIIDITAEIIDMFKNNIIKGCGTESFTGWCEDGDVFGNDNRDECIELMHKVTPTVDQLTAMLSAKEDTDKNS